jgi:Tol biopolymer transport system component
VIDTTNWNVKHLGKNPIDPKRFGGTTSSLLSGIAFGGKIYSGFRNKNGTEIYYSDAKSAGHKTVLKFPNRKDKITQIDIINNGNSILFSGNYNRETGIFVYDMINKSIKKVVKLDTACASVDSMTFSLSPDKTKILYEVPEINKHGYAKLYIAAIQKNDILENKLLYQNTPDNSISPSDLHVVWARDSKSFIACEYHKNNEARTGFRKYTIVAASSK